MARSIGVLVGFLAALLLAGNHAQAQSRVALVVGNGNYVAAGTLNNRIGEARAMEEKLRRDLGYTVEFVPDATRATMLAALERFAVASAGADVALFYFTGYVLESGGSNFLIPVDARMTLEREIEGKSVSLEQVFAQIAPAKAKLVLVDACPTNPLAQQLSISDPGRGVPRGLVPVRNPPPGTLVSFATAPGPLAGCDETNSPFNTQLRRLMALVDEDVRTVLGKVVEAVKAFTQRQRTPQIPSVASNLSAPVTLRGGVPTGAVAAPGGPAANSRPPPPGNPTVGNPTLPGGSVAGVIPPLVAPVAGMLTPPVVPIPVPVPIPVAPGLLPGLLPGATASAPAAPATPGQQAPGLAPVAVPLEAPQVARTPLGFGCPGAGTVVKSIVGRERMETTYGAGESHDPATCVGSSDDGKRFKRLFNFFDNPGALEADFKQGFAELLAGRRKSIHRNATIGSIDPFVGGHQRIGGKYSDEWENLGNQTVDIGGRKRTVTVLNRSLHAIGGSARTEVTYWFDVETGLWVKAAPASWSPNFHNAYTVTSIAQR